MKILEVEIYDKNYIFQEQIFYKEKILVSQSMMQKKQLEFIDEKL